ncbi:20100_t:CDS:1, partial [Gigaspora margarita]
ISNNDNNSEEIESSEIQNKDSIKTLQQHLINQTNNPYITKIQSAPSKKRIQSTIEISKVKTAVQEITSQVSNMQESCTAEPSLRLQRKCLLCEQTGHYQKKYPSAKEK